MSSQRQFSGSVLRAQIAWLEKNGLLAAVRERVPAETVGVLDKPPMAVSWFPARHVDAILEALLAVGGEEKVEQLGLETTRSSFGRLVRPLLQTLMSLFGASPAVLFKRLDESLPLFVKGASFEYEPGAENEGVLHLRTVGMAPRAFCLQWKGVLRFAFEMASVEGSVNSCELDPDGQGAVFHVAW